MNNSIKEALKNVQNGDVIDQLFAILELPDEEFNFIYPNISKSLKDSLNSEILRKQLIEQLKITPITDLKSELAGFQQLITEINKDTELVGNKKELLMTLLNSSKELILDITQNPREKINVRIMKINEDAIIPTYAHNTDAGADIYAIEDVEISPHTTVIVKTGLKVAIPSGYEIQIRPRSGMSLKTTIRIPNSPATIDSKKGLIHA